MLDNQSTKGELRISARHFAHCNEKAFEVALWKQTILQTKEMDLKNIAEGTTDPRVDFVSCIPDICHFFYTNKTFGEKNLHRKNA